MKDFFPKPFPSVLPSPRFPRLKSKTHAGAETGGQVETGQVEQQMNISPCDIPGAKVKAKEKGHKFGIHFPKSKHTKSASALETVELKPPSVNIKPPSVEFSLSGDKDTEKGQIQMNAPDVEFAVPSGQESLSDVKGKADIKTTTNVDIKGGVDAEASVGEVDIDMGKGDAKLKMPKLKLPRVRLSRHSDEIDGDIKIKAKGDFA